MRSACGAGDMDTEQHRDNCLLCFNAYWREQHPRLAEVGFVLGALLFFAFLGLLVAAVIGVIR